MRKLLLSMMATGLSSLAFAQPVFQQSNIQTGSSFAVYSITNPDPAKLIPNGANVNWDMTGVNKVLIGGVTFLPMDSTPYASTYPDANFAMRIVAGSNVLYNIFKLSSTNFEQIANNLGGSSTTYDILRDVLQFPLNFNDTFYDEYQKNGQAATISLFAYDGYGKITTDAGEITDIARVLEIRDSGTGDTSALWWRFKDGKAHPIMEANDDGVFMWEEVVTTAVSKINKELITTLFPNPASGKVFIDLENANGNSVIHIYSLNGQLVFSADVMHAVSIDISSLSKGMYYYSIVDSDDKVKYGKLAVE